jgi:uridine phosphorylase
MAVHLHPTAELAPRALLPGDPGRALLLAQLLTSGPKMFNHNRGLWGYTGIAADGEPLTIQSTGMGGPSAAIVLEELCDLGLRHAIRVGTCGALASDLALGDLVVADAALAADGTSQALGAAARVVCDAALVEALRVAAGAIGGGGASDLTAGGAGCGGAADPLRARVRVGTVATSDLFYDRDPARARAWVSSGALAVEMEAAALLRVGELRGVAIGCLLAVTDTFDADDLRHRMDADGVVAVGERLGLIGAAALAALAAAANVDPEASGSA